MALQASLGKYKTELADAATRNAAFARPSSTAPARISTPKPTESISVSSDTVKRSHDTAFSQPPSTSTGHELMTQVWHAINYLKEKNSPLSFESLINYLSLPQDAMKNVPYIKKALQTHDRVQFVPKNESSNGKDSFKYRPLHPVTNTEELKEYLARATTAQGVAVKDLKDGWPGCIAAIDELEKSGTVLVTRLKKDNTPRMVWADSPSYHIHVDTDFVDFWTKTKLPATETEIRNELEKAGITPTSQIKETRNDNMKKKDRKRPIRRGGRTTNQHMMGILKDYSRR